MAAICSRCGLRSAALQVAGAWDSLVDGSPEAAAEVADVDPSLYSALAELSEEVGRDEHDDAQG